MLDTGVWRSLKMMENSDLQRLADGLPILVLRCKAKSTTKKYFGAYKRWKAWATVHNLTAFPGKESKRSLISSTSGKGQKLKSGSRRGSEWTGLGTCHVWRLFSQGFTDCTRGLRKKLPKPVNKKLPFTVEMLQLIAQDAQKQNTLASLRLAAACLLTFAGFLRFNELAEVKLCDFAVGSDHL